jgi:predicted GH43/DUF377 family glycosyl hydrolase
MITEPLTKIALKRGGFLKPIILPYSEKTNGTGLMNPSILLDNGKLIMCLRHVNYTLYHSEKKLFPHEWGPLIYLHPETKPWKLLTTNYYVELDDSYNISKFSQVDTTKMDKTPIWDFVGLEDARLIRWNGKLYLSGVRRDTTTNGQGRIELSEITLKENTVEEVSRVRLQPPIDPSSYCEKNWMPILDKPYHYVKWSNPTEVVVADIKNGNTKQLFIPKTERVPVDRDFRGGSQLIPWRDHYVALTHEVLLWFDKAGRKDGIYRHRLLLWDNKFNLVKWSDDFTFLGGEIEFACGLVHKDGMFIASYGFQDNSACISGIPEKMFEELLGL